MLFRSFLVRVVRGRDRLQLHNQWQAETTGTTQYGAKQSTSTEVSCEQAAIRGRRFVQSGPIAWHGLYLTTEDGEVPGLIPVDVAPEAVSVNRTVESTRPNRTIKLPNFP